MQKKMITSTVLFGFISIMIVGFWAVPRMKTHATEQNHVWRNNLELTDQLLTIAKKHYDIAATLEAPYAYYVCTRHPEYACLYHKHVMHLKEDIKNLSEDREGFSRLLNLGALRRLIPPPEWQVDHDHAKTHLWNWLVIFDTENFVIQTHITITKRYIYTSMLTLTNEQAKIDLFTLHTPALKEVERLETQLRAVQPDIKELQQKNLPRIKTIY